MEAWVNHDSFTSIMTQFSGDKASMDYQFFDSVSSKIQILCFGKFKRKPMIMRRPQTPLTILYNRVVSF